MIPMITEGQGDEIIALLQKILWELEKMNVNVDRIDNNVTSLKIDADFMK
jgi:hypothetical protein